MMGNPFLPEDVLLPNVDEWGRPCIENSQPNSIEPEKHFTASPGMRTPSPSGLLSPGLSSAGSPPETAQAKPGTKKPGDADQSLKHLKTFDLVAFNKNAEQIFCELIVGWLQEEGDQPVSAVLAEGAFELDVSTETVKRYLLKHSARRAEFRVQDGMVSLRERMTR